MKIQFKVTELSHDELVHLFSPVFCDNNADHIDWSDKTDNLKDGQGNCFEERLANILLNGGEIMITGVNVRTANEFHKGNKLKTSVETIAPNNWIGEEEFNFSTCHITFQDVCNGLSEDKALSYVQELLIDEDGK